MIIVDGVGFVARRLENGEWVLAMVVEKNSESVSGTKREEAPDEDAFEYTMVARFEREEDAQVFAAWYRMVNLSLEAASQEFSIAEENLMR